MIGKLVFAAVVLWLWQAHQSGSETLTKDQIIRWAGSHLHIAMEDGAAGFNKWSNAKHMEAKGWVQRIAYSRWAGLQDLWLAIACLFRVKAAILGMLMPNLLLHCAAGCLVEAAQLGLEAEKTR
jgi:hypothetical protein